MKRLVHKNDASAGQEISDGKDDNIYKYVGLDESIHIRGQRGGPNGRSVHAARPFAPGDLIAKFNQPDICIPDGPNISLYCNHCMAHEVPLKACSGCKLVRYCGAACQKKNWKLVHKKECEAFQEISKKRGSFVYPTACRAALQVVLHPELQESFMKLEGNIEEYKKDKKSWENLKTMASGVFLHNPGDLTEQKLDYVTELICKVQTNAFTRSIEDGGEGIFLDTTLSMINHSCIPNAVVEFSKRTAFLRPLTNIPVGEEIMISYIDYGQSLQERQQALQGYHFECKCLRCKDDLDVYQVWQQSQDVITMNKMSLVPDIAKLGSLPRSLSPKAGSDLRPITLTDEGLALPLPERRQYLRKAYNSCKPLSAASRWAMEPLPQIITETSIYYAARDNYPCALALACLLATKSDPYKYVVPYHTLRLKSLFYIAKLLGNTAPDPPKLIKCAELLAKKRILDDDQLYTIRNLDHVSLCQMILIMITNYAPMGHSTEWDVLHQAIDMIQEIESLPGREKENGLIKNWSKNIYDPEMEHLLDYGVAQPVAALANLGIGILKLDFEDGQDLCAP